MKNKRILTGASIALLFIAGLAIFFSLKYKESRTVISESPELPAPAAPRVTNPKPAKLSKPKEYHSTAVIAGVGDVLIHDRVYNEFKTSEGYDFHTVFTPVKELMKKPDLLIANQESTPGGTKLGLSSYPSFNSPQEIIDAIMDAGVDFVTNANNHSLDKGEKGIQSAISYYEKKNLPYTGSFKSKEDQQKLRIETVNGIRIAILAYTFGTNGIPIPDGKTYLVNYIEPNKVLEDIKNARSKADLVVLSLHWGIEYQRQPNDEQKKLAKLFTNGGADIILGSHPHVLEPIQKLHTKDGRNAYVIYSMGNFISGQVWDYKDIGGMIEFTVQKDVTSAGSETFVRSVNFLPTYVSQRIGNRYAVYPLETAFKKGWETHSPAEIETFMGMDSKK